jgi:transcriptional antiterminator RfaH
VLRWYLVHTKPRAEATAKEHLERQGYEVYFPLAVQQVARHGRWLQRIVALFPRYMFLRLNEGAQGLSPVRSTTGVTGVVRFGTEYSVVPDGVIRELRARADPGSGLHTLNSTSSLASGAPVEVRSGPFDGLSGVFERQAGAERVVVLLKFLGQDASVCVPLAAVAAH